MSATINGGSNSIPPQQPAAGKQRDLVESLQALPAVQGQFQQNIDKYSKAGFFEWVPIVGGKQQRMDNLEAARAAKENADFFIRKLYEVLMQSVARG